MTESDLDRLVASLSTARRAVYEAISEHGPVSDYDVHSLLQWEYPAAVVAARRGELVRIGLVRQAGKEGRRKTWMVTPASEVEAARLEAPRVRHRDLDKLPLGLRTHAFLALARDKEVQKTVLALENGANRRDRARLRDVLRQDEKARRERERELRDTRDASVEFIRIRNRLKDSADQIRAIAVMLHEDLDRGESAIPPQFWDVIPELLKEVIEHAEEAYEDIARSTGHPSRREVDIEISEDEIEDAEIAELVETLGEGMAEDS